MTALPEVSDQALTTVRRQSDKELERLVRQELDKRKVAGKFYPLKFEPRCRVCQNIDICPRVNELLACGLAYTDVLRTIRPWNEHLPKKKQVTYNSIWTHAQNHLQYDKMAFSIHRQVIERRALEMEQDFIAGTSGALNVYSYLEVLRDIAFKNMINNEGEVSPLIGMQAAVKLHELEKEDEEGRRTADAWVALNRIIKAVKAHCDPSQIASIYAELDGESVEEPIDVEYEEDEEFEPEFEPGEDKDTLGER